MDQRTGDTDCHILLSS
ncbi:hypothetical protein VULLAG_LOCUS9748 [Vulpes lagopus]